MPPDHRLRHRVGRGEVGFQVEERRIVEAVEPDHPEAGAFDADEAHDAQRDRIGAGGGSQ